MASLLILYRRTLSTHRARIGRVRTRPLQLRLPMV